MESTEQKGQHIAFVADTQAPMWIEGVFLRKDNNPEATKKILADILAGHPKATFMLGDVVALGISSRAWIVIDYFLKQFASAGIPVYGLLGNHELMQRPLKGEKVFQKYFPEHVRTGYVKIVDSLAVIMLNSNFSTLSADDIIIQNDWYRKTLGELDTDPGIAAIIVCCHHSPFTNSSMVRSSKNVQQEFVPYYLNSKKCRLFLSGHAHLFEHYRYKEKDFLVIGGGGGLRHPLSRSILQLPDLAKDYKPAFHYITLSLNHDQLQVISHRLKPDFSGFEEGLKLAIPLEAIAKND
jgi:hypothetical protein